MSGLFISLVYREGNLRRNTWFSFLIYLINKTLSSFPVGGTKFSCYLFHSYREKIGVKRDTWFPLLPHLINNFFYLSLLWRTQSYQNYLFQNHVEKAEVKWDTRFPFLLSLINETFYLFFLVTNTKLSELLIPLRYREGISEARYLIPFSNLLNQQLFLSFSRNKYKVISIIYFPHT